MSITQIQCSLDQQYILTPCNMPNPNLILVMIQYNDTPESGKTAVVSWAGGAKAFLTFDPTGTQVISYTLTVNDYATQASIENILRVL